LKSAFHKISKVGSLTGGTKWYLSDDCLLAAKRLMYSVEYRRFYLRDLESIVVWPKRYWWLRPVVPGAQFGALGFSLWVWVNTIAGGIFLGIAVGWVVLELVLGPRAGACIRTNGAKLEMPIVNRISRAQKILSKIDAAVRTHRGIIQQPSSSGSIFHSPGAVEQSGAEPSAPTSIAATGTNAS
jgi:hypothetical protein